ncbi:MAG: OmpA family protein [Gammaproteobacteria bacterium]|nr:OmpA family protein [Gammaproteobacteria bacterium]
MSRSLRLSKACLFLLGPLLLTLMTPSHAAIFTWNGNGDDTNWNTCINWTPSCPGSDDIATFNSTSSKDVTITANLDVAGIDIQADYGGVINQNGATITVGNNGFSQDAGTFTGNSAPININGDLIISNGSFTATSATTSISGNFTKSDGLFFHNNGTVEFNGINQTISGSNDFHNINKIATSDTLTFSAGRTQSFAGLATFQGTDTGTLMLRSSIPGARANLNFNGTTSFNYLNIQDSDASSSTVNTPIDPANSINNGGTIGWFIEPRNAVTSVIAEITPNSEFISAVNRHFSFYMLPTINTSAGDTGLDQITIITPIGYSNTNISDVIVDTTTLAPSISCPAVGMDEYCASIAGQTININLGSTIINTLTPMRIDFNTDTPGLLGNATFAFSVDNTTERAQQFGTAGNANANIANDSLDVNLLMPGNAVTSVVAEITPSEVLRNRTSLPFSFYLRPTINTGNKGLNQTTILLPSGYTNINVTDVLVDNIALTSGTACPAINADEYCAAVTGETITLDFGTLITTSLSEIRVDFTSDTPGQTGTATLSYSVDDTITRFLPPQPGDAGNADGNDTNSNGLNISLVNNTQPLSTVTISPSIIIADGNSTALITIQLLNKDKQPLIGKQIQIASSRGGSDTIIQPATVTDNNGITQGFISSSLVGIATLTVLNTTDRILISPPPQVTFTQGNILSLTKTANKNDVMVGDIITYTVEVKNNTSQAVEQVSIDNIIPDNFKSLDNTLLNGAPASSLISNKTLSLDLGTLPALIDTNNNGEADPGETGYTRIDYQLIVGSGVTPGSYRSSAIAKDSCSTCSVSNQATADVNVTTDPLFDLGTIIGKVFNDKNSNHWQDPDEPGIADAMVVLDEGTYAITDNHGRYHFPAVTPGERLLKINIASLPVGTMPGFNETQIISVSPGLLAKANFGVVQNIIVEKLGRPGIKGLKLSANTQARNITLIGNAEKLSINVNGSYLPMLQAEVRMHTNNTPSEILEFNDDKIVHPAYFHINVSRPDEIDAWQLQINSANGNNIKTFSGGSTPPDTIKWNGSDHIQNQSIGNTQYHYQLTVNYRNGTHAASARRIIGIEQRSNFKLNISDETFGIGSFTLNDNTKKTLKDAAVILRQYPRERIIVTGWNSDSSENQLPHLAKKRAETAHAYLVGVEGISPFRLSLHWKTEGAVTNNIASDKHYLLTRIVINKKNTGASAVASATLNGKPLKLDNQGRFALRTKEHDLLLELITKNGRATSTRLIVPKFSITHPAGEILIPYFSEKSGTEDSKKETTTAKTDPAGHFELTGHAAAKSIIKIGKQTIQAAEDGTFSYPMTLAYGTQSLQIEIQDPQGFPYVKILTMNVQSHQQNRQIYLQQPIPELQLNLPPSGFVLREGDYTFSGTTSPDNAVLINNNVIDINAAGEFSHTLTLKKGENPLHVKIIDPRGYISTVEHMIGAGKPKLFFMAFADGKFSSLNTKGFIQGNGQKSSREFYSEGRLAFYLKGMVQGKYLITAALDTGQGKVSSLFNDLDDDGARTLLSNLDPDRYYPVYGDNSTIVYDTQSQGKFYLAVDSDTIHSVVGNYKLNLSDNELAAYRRTLYGAFFEYKSLSSNRNDKPDTLIRLFGAQTRQSHVRDEMRATGGSLYYLSQREIIEGSEQVTLVVKDKNTGLTLSRQPQRQNIDYSIKYLAGRLLFNRPVSSKQQDNNVINSALLAGNPVYIEVDYEYRVAAFEKKAAGAHLRHQLTDQIAIGATHVNDELSSGRYELQGLDGEIRILNNSRIIAEIAKSRGSEGEVFNSNDGGLSFAPISNNQQSGQAIKIAAEIDIGEFSGKPDRIKAGVYIKKLDSGFQASGNSSDQGQQKTGANLMIRVTDKNTVRLKYDLAQGTDQAQAGSVDASLHNSAQWIYQQEQWSLAGEFQDQSSEDRNGTQLNRESLAAARLTSTITRKLEASIRHQTTLNGTPNDQNTIGLKYNITQNLHLEGSATSGDQGDAGEARLGYRTEKITLYLTERVNDDKSGKTTSTIIGGETSIATIAGADSGKIYSEYQWGNSDNQDKSLSLVGAEQQWKIENGWKLNLGSEYSDINTLSDIISRNTFVVGLSYMEKGLKASTRHETRNDRGTERKRQLLTSSSIEYNLNPDYILFGKYRYSITRNLTKQIDDARFDEQSIGFAYRPTSHDRFNALTRYTRLSDLRPLSLNNVTAVTTQMDVFSIEWSYQINKKLEWTEKQAIRIKTEQVGRFSALKTQTHLSIHRLNYGLPWHFRLGLEYRTLQQKQANDRRTGWLSEITWEANRHMRLGLGYNFTDFSDNEFSANDYSTEGWFVRIQGKY